MSKPDLSYIDDALKKIAMSKRTDLVELNEKTKPYFIKGAFDIYRSVNDPYGAIWILEDINGKPHLVRSSDPKYDYKDDGNWTVSSSYNNDNVTLLYKKVPITKFTSKQYGFQQSDILKFKEALLENIKEVEFVKDILLEQPEAKISALTKTFPELKKFIKE